MYLLAGHTDTRIEKSREAVPHCPAVDSESALSWSVAEWAQLIGLVHLEMSEAVTGEW